jgi:hypothetical protein
VIRLVYKAGKQDTMQTSGKLAKMMRAKFNVVPMIIDIIGIGSGVFDRLREQGLNVYPFQGSEGAYNPERFLNRRAESYWLFRERMEDGLIDLDEADDDLASQLQSIKWDTNSRGQIFMESKKDMKKRGLPSPDRADAAVMSDQEPPVMLEEDELDHEPDLTSDLMGRQF